MTIVVEDGIVRVERPDNEGFHRGLHGLTRSLLANMVDGVTQGFEKRLRSSGVGYRAAMKGKRPRDPGRLLAPGARSAARRASSSRCRRRPQIVVRGNDKQQVGEVAANIRKVRKPEPYKGKGIRYEGEDVRKKAGKAAKRCCVMDAKTKRARGCAATHACARRCRASADRPRLAVYRSNRHIYAQLIDDRAAATHRRGVRRRGRRRRQDGRAKAVGRTDRQRAKDAGIERAVFDRGGRRYHGRVAAVADGAREGGLQI